MESRIVLITLGVFAGLAILFQGASSATEVSRGGGECNDAKTCCGAQNCHVIDCDNSDQVNLAVLSGIGVAQCDDIANNLTAAALIGIVAEVTGIGNAGPCGSSILNDVLVLVLGSSKNYQCCNGDVNNGLGGGVFRGDSDNCNNIVNKCTAACGHQGGSRGGKVINQCKSDCCTIATCS